MKNLEAFVDLSEGSGDIQDAHADFLLHLYWHRLAQVLPDMKNNDLPGALKKMKASLVPLGSE